MSANKEPLVWRFQSGARGELYDIGVSEARRERSGTVAECLNLENAVVAKGRA